jgi:hypothetical protein
MTLVHSLAVAALLPLAGIIPRPEPVQALAEFIERVADYVEIRREVTAGVDGPIFCSDPEELSRQAAQRAAAIRDARPLASEGTIFTPRAAVYFRERIAHAARIGAIDLAIESGQPDEVVPEVNAVLPWGAAEPASAPLVGLLPPLPDELEYRFVGRDLVLLDVEVKLVVDVLRKAVPALVETPANRSAGGCQVHPELPACWM